MSTLFTWIWIEIELPLEQGGALGGVWRRVLAVGLEQTSGRVALLVTERRPPFCQLCYHSTWEWRLRLGVRAGFYYFTAPR